MASALPGRPEKNRPLQGAKTTPISGTPWRTSAMLTVKSVAAVDEFLGAVERIDQEEGAAEIGRHDAGRRLFLGHAGNVGKGRAQPGEDDRLALAVGFRHRRGVGLSVDRAAGVEDRASPRARPRAPAARRRPASPRRQMPPPSSYCSSAMSRSFSQCSRTSTISSADLPSVLRWISGFSGASYGESTPVKFLISPLSARA